MNHWRPAHRRESDSLTGREGLERALRTHEVDAIVGDRAIMLVRLKQAEDDLESSRDQLRALAGHLLSVRDSERAAIARELHDEFGQALTSLQLGLAWLARNVTPEQRPLLKKITVLSDATTGLIRSVKDITVELRPGAVDELGLTKALKSSTMEFEGTAGIPCRFRTNAGGRQIQPSRGGRGVQNRPGGIDQRRPPRARVARRRLADGRQAPRDAEGEGRRDGYLQEARRQPGISGHQRHAGT